MEFNYAFIILGNITIDGWIDWYDYYTDTINIVIDGIKYRTAKCNVLLMYKAKD